MHTTQLISLCVFLLATSGALADEQLTTIANDEAATGASLLDSQRLSFAAYDWERASEQRVEAVQDTGPGRKTAVKLLVGGAAVSGVGLAGIIGGVVLANTSHTPSGWFDFNMNPFFGAVIEVLGGTLLVSGVIMAIIATVLLSREAAGAPASKVGQDEPRLVAPAPRPPPAPTMLVQLARF